LNRIAIDYTPAYEQGGGIGRYVRELVTSLAEIDKETPYSLFIAGAGQLGDSPEGNFQWKPTKISPKWFARIWHRLRMPIPIDLFTGQLNLFHATDFVLPPTLPTTKTILTVHDLSFIRVPDAASPRLRAYLNQVVPRSVKNANHILADSQATKEDIVEFYDTPAEKITVLLSGVDKIFMPQADKSQIDSVRQKYQIGSKPYIFTIGTVQPRKNYSRLIQALARLRENKYDVQLVIAGGKGWLEDEMYQTIEETKLFDFVKLIGFADEVDLPTLYSDAMCFAFPSLYEGFGLPILESMACGTPVVTSNISSLPEVAGNDALLVDPYDVEELAYALERILTDTELRQKLVDGGLQRAKAFTWERSAIQLRSVYQQILDE